MLHHEKISFPFQPESSESTPVRRSKRNLLPYFFKTSIISPNEHSKSAVESILTYVDGAHIEG
jgi:hypothetical protein